MTTSKTALEWFEEQGIRAEQALRQIPYEWLGPAGKKLIKDSPEGKAARSKKVVEEINRRLPNIQGPVAACDNKYNQVIFNEVAFEVDEAEKLIGWSE